MPVCKLYVAFLQQHHTLILSSFSLLKEILLKIWVKPCAWNRTLCGICKFEHLADYALFRPNNYTPYGSCILSAQPGAAVSGSASSDFWARHANKLPQLAFLFFFQWRQQLLCAKLCGLHSEIWDLWRTGKSSWRPTWVQMHNHNAVAWVESPEKHPVSVPMPVGSEGSIQY